MAPDISDLNLHRKRWHWRATNSPADLVEPSPAQGAASHPHSGASTDADSQEKLIRVKVARDTLTTVFQPIVELQTGRTVGAEALSRFSNPPLRPPDLWFEEAADVGMQVELEVTALHTALKQLRQLPSGLYLSLNASPATMVSSDFRSVISDVESERLVLELTEHTGIENYEAFREAIAHLRSRGLRLAIDDAGSGFSSFRHILNLRPDIIKLDITITRGIDSDPARKALGSALLAFGLDAYNATIVAEGIETAGELDTLRALGCRFGQGFYLGRPGEMQRIVTHVPLTGVLASSAVALGAATGNGGRSGDPSSGTYAQSLALFAEISESLAKPEEHLWTA